MDIAAWLQGLGLERYVPAFRDNEIDWEVLPKLTSEDLREIGVAAIGHRRKLLDAIAALGAAVPTATVTAAPSDAPAPTDAERRQLTVMFCDLVGSTPLSTRFDPEDLRDIIGAYHRCVAETVARFAGFVAKYMGDGVLIYFGYPEAHEDDAERAIRAGLAAIDAVGRLATPERLNMRLGIASGLVVVGDLIGAGAALERGVVGETPNLAARLQALARPGTLVIAEGTRRQIGSLFEVEDLGPQPLAGFAEPQRAWRVIGESGVLSRFEALRSEATPLVGRDEELDLLLRRWQQAKAGEGRVVLVAGEPGIGKSRLTAELGGNIAREPHTRLRYFCSPHHQDSALYPFIAQLERAAGFARDDTVEQKLGKLLGLLAAGARGDHEIQLLAELLSLPNSAADFNFSPQRKREMLFEALLHQLEALSRSRPVLMVFEDAHWIDPTSRELLDLTLDRIARLPILLVVTFRPEFQHAWSGQPQVTTLALNRLGGHDGAALVDRLAGNAGLGREIVDEIVERADGVPLFVEELTKAVLESGERDHRVAAVLAASPLPSLAIPPTLHASLISRLDRLGPVAKEVGQVGAVIGREFSYDLIEQVAQCPATELRLGLDRLTEAGLLFCRGLAPQSSYLFKHALVQDAAYSTLLRARRQELHARIAKVLEDRFPEIVDYQPEILAHHFTQAGLADPAIEFWRRAGVRNIAQSAHSEAAAHLESALDLLGKLAPCEERNKRELELTLSLAVPLIAIHGFGSLRVEECALSAKELSDKLRQSSRRFAAQRVAWNSCLMRQPVPKTVTLARELVELAEEDEDPAKLAVAQRALGYSLFVAGEFGEAIERLQKGIALSDALSEREFAVYGEHPGMVCRIYAGQAKILMGFPETAARLIDAAIAHARHEKNAHSLAWALAVAAHSCVTQHEAQATVRFASEAIDTAREHRLPQWLALGERCKGWAVHQLGDFSAGLDLQKIGVSRWYETGAALHTTHCEIILAESLLLEGLAAPARAHLDRARAHRANYGEEYVAAEIDRLEALLLENEQSPAEIVEEHLTKALTIARRQGARLLELRTATTLARVLAQKGELRKAVDLLAPVYGWFTEGFDTADLKEAKALLDQLA
jgi:class 3 adenylate cyclase/predicted ATPase